MRIALAGVGRMGSAIAERLRAAGHHLFLYDPRLEPGGEVQASLAAAARRSVVTFLCLPDAAAVEACLPDLSAAAPPLVVDLTSSLPRTTRHMAAALAHLGVDFVDCPMSGGVAGARAGTLTLMVGGDQAILERIRPVLAGFASNVRWAGPLGAGDATKALNNSLSGVSLLGTAEMLVTAAAYGADEAEVVAAFNAGPARSQNSEVKYPRDILPRTYAAGFAAGLMEKDIGTAALIAEERATPAPLLAATLGAWRVVTEAEGREADFTRVHAVVDARRGGGPAALDDFSPDVLVRALAALNLAAAREMLSVAAAEGLDRKRVLAIVNTSTGRTEATRSGLRGEIDWAALADARELAARAGVWAPLTATAAGLGRSMSPVERSEV